MDRLFFAIGSASGLVGVAAGAFGAHALRGRIDAGQLEVYETAVRYQLLHAVALLAVAWAVSRWPSGPAALAGWLFLVGTVLFSGSLYTLSLSGVRWLGAVTPFGGLAFLAGWACLVWAAYRG